MTRVSLPQQKLAMSLQALIPELTREQQAQPQRETQTLTRTLWMSFPLQAATGRDVTS